MALKPRDNHARFATVLSATLLAVVVAGPGAAGAAVPTPSCLGKPATIVGQGTIHGTAHADVIVAGPGDDHIFGGAADDRICAGGGGDTIEGGPGSDQIEADPGDDEVIGGNGSDHVLGGPGTDTVFGNRGNDDLEGGPGTDFLDSGLGDDTVDGGPGYGDEVIGGIGTDHLYGGSGDGDVLEGDLGTDSLDGGPGAHDAATYALAGRGDRGYDGTGVEVDLAAGFAKGDGEDTLVGVEDVVGTPFADTIRGDAEENGLYGGGGIDELVGSGAGDAAFGGTGEDLCREVASAESCELSGATGRGAVAEVAVQTAYYERRVIPPSFEVDLAGGNDTGALTGIVEHGTELAVKQGMQVHVAFLEGAWILTEQGLPMAVGEGCALLNPEVASCPVATTPTGLFLNGSEGADLLAEEPSVPATVSARMVGGRGPDTLVGGAGDDNLDATLDHFGGDPANSDAVYGGTGDDALTNAAILDGQSGSDLLIAQPCAGETVDGGPGVDSVSFARVEHGVEATLGGVAGLAPEDGYPAACLTEPGASQIDTSVERIEGSTYDDILTGDAEANVILGRGGSDEIFGAGGNDFLVGGEGIDALYGEGGADRLYARDGGPDKTIECSAGRRVPTPGDVAVTDPSDPPARHCLEPGTRSGSR